MLAFFCNAYILYLFVLLWYYIYMLKVGDVVFLKNNPERLMTVSAVFGITKFTGVKKFFEKQFRKIGFCDGDVQCFWFDGKKYNGSFFKAHMLKLKNSNTAPQMFKVGDRVFLRSDPEMLMTVTLVVGNLSKDIPGFFRERFERKAQKRGYSDGDVQCQWSIGLRHKIGLISAAMLEKKV